MKIRTKKLLAWLLAILMLVARFSACANGTGQTDDQGRNSTMDGQGMADEEDGRWALCRAPRLYGRLSGRRPVVWTAKRRFPGEYRHRYGLWARYRGRGVRLFNPAIVYSFMTLSTVEEAQVISMYKTDLVDTQLSPSQNRFRRNTLHRRICMACFLKSCRKTTYSWKNSEDFIMSFKFF